MRQLAVAKVNDDDQWNLYVLAGWRNSGQHPIHFDGVREFEDHLIYDALYSDGARDRSHRGVGWHLGNEALGIKFATLIVSHAAGHHRNVIDISVRDHRFQSIFGVARGEFILDVFIPTIREGFLGS